MKNITGLHVLLRCCRVQLRQAKKTEPSNDCILKYAVFAHFGPILACFRLFLALEFLEIFPGQHILLTVSRHKVDKAKEVSQTMILYLKMQILSILAQF